MHARTWILVGTLGAVVGTGAYHWRAQRARARLEAEQARHAATAAEQRGLLERDSRQAVAAHAAQETNRAEQAPGAAASKDRRNASVANATSTPGSQAPSVATNPELRAWQVQAFVSEQRLRFAALLKRLGLTPAQRQEFDRIHADYQHAMLNAAPGDDARQQARPIRDARLEELFGAQHEEWVAASRDEPARAIVNQIVQMTFQSSGALTTAQADELTRLVAQHRIRPARGASAAPPGYDWERIMADANEILAPRQREDFAVAIAFRRASETMSAIAAKRK